MERKGNRRWSHHIVGIFDDGAAGLKFLIAGSRVEECHVGDWIQQHSLLELSMSPLQLNSVADCSTPCSLSFWLVAICLLGPVLRQEQSKGCCLGVERVGEKQRVACALDHCHPPRAT
jgi:hypothetical protein